MRLFGKAVLVSFLVAIASVSVFACECAEVKSESESLAISDAVFIGDVISVDRSTWTTTFEVRQWLKGTRTNTVVISGSTYCGMWFDPGLTYIVYAEEFEGKLKASTCLSTRHIDYFPRVTCGTVMRGRSYGDIALVTGICVTLSIGLGVLVGAISSRFKQR